MSIQDIQERVRGFNTHDCKVSFKFIFKTFFLSLVLVVGENTNRHRDLLDRFE